MLGQAMQVRMKHPADAARMVRRAALQADEGFALGMVALEE
jgi:hypothetical protein